MIRKQLMFAASVLAVNAELTADVSERAGLRIRASKLRITTRCAWKLHCRINKSWRLTMVILLVVVLILLAVLGILGFQMAGYSMGIRRQTLEEARKWQEDHYDLSWYDELEKTEYTVSGEDGYQLHVQRLINPKLTERAVIISHGYTDNRFGALKYAKIYLDLGFDVIVYDLRGHGANEPTFCTYSIREGKDLAALIRDTRARYPELTVLGLHGESLGAASTVACLRYRPDVTFAVADCAFSEITSVLEGGLRSMNVPAFMVRIASFCARLRYGYSFAEMRPIDSLKGSDLPILFIHGAEDKFILPSHSEALCRAAGEKGVLKLIPGAGHAESVLRQPETYRETVTEFVSHFT